MGSKNNPGTFDCYAAARPDEPMFILLGRDPMAGALVRCWAAMRRAKGEDLAKVAEAEACADALDAHARSFGKVPLERIISSSEPERSGQERKEICCKNCGSEISPKVAPSPLPDFLRNPIKLLASSKEICGAKLVDGIYRGTQSGAMYGLNASPEEIDWDDFRARNECKHCGQITQLMCMLTVKCCEHCGAYFDREKIIYLAEEGEGNKATRTPPTAAYCEKVLLGTRERYPDVVIEVPTNDFEPHYWCEQRTLESPHSWSDLHDAHAAGRLVGVDGDPRRAWVGKILDLVRRR